MRQLGLAMRYTEQGLSKLLGQLETRHHSLLSVAGSHHSLLSVAGIINNKIKKT
ncbi:MAG: hypothetical protein ACR5LF_06965 [Symbiopectobacterium sp.]